MTNQENFHKLWDDTLDGVQYCIFAQRAKSLKEINNVIHNYVWKSKWGDKTLVPPERQFLNELKATEPEKARKIEALLNNFRIKANPLIYVGAVIALAGAVAAFFTNGLLQIGSFALLAAGAVMLIVPILKNKRAEAMRQLKKTGEICETILSE